MRALAILAAAVIGFGAGFLASVLFGVPEWAPWLAVTGAGVLGAVVARLVPRSARVEQRRRERDWRVQRFDD